MSINLDPQQSKAVEHGTGPLLINAGAGSGKTATLTNRVASLIQRGEDPETIFVGTFTKNAALEMRERLVGMVGEEMVQRIGHLGTLHSFGLRVIREFWGKEFANGRGSRSSVLGGSEATSLMGYLLRERDNFNTIGLGIGEEYGIDQDQVNSVASTIQRLKDGLVTPDVYERREDSDAGIARLYRAYEKAKAQGWKHPKTHLAGCRVFDFGDMLIETYRILKTDAATLARWQAAFKWVLVDEAQDNNMAQYLITRMIAAPEMNLTYVGDDYQAIYGFRGAAPAEFIASADGATVIPLETNYRSRPEIVEAANRLMSHNKGQLHKTCTAHRKG